MYRKLDIHGPPSQIYTGTPSAANTSNPILFVSNGIDPATPLRVAREMRAEFGGAGLLVQDAAEHGSLGNWSPCTHSWIAEYVEDANLPPEGTICQSRDTVVRGVFLYRLARIEEVPTPIDDLRLAPKAEPVPVFSAQGYRLWLRRRAPRPFIVVSDNGKLLTRPQSPRQYRSRNMSTLFSALGSRIYGSPQSKSHQTPLPCASTHIRLLDLYPPKSDSAKSAATLNGRLYSTPIDSPSPYKALSYAWGTGGRTHSIHLSDIEVKITASLDEAIRHFRHPKEVVTLWIDQICIDQENDLEKNDQIPLMGKIYSSATEGVNLGRPDRRRLRRANGPLCPEFCLGADTFFVCGQKWVRVELVESAILIFGWGGVEILKSEGSDAENVHRYQCLVTNPTSALFAARKRKRGFDSGTGSGAGLFDLFRGRYVGNKVEATDPKDRIFGILSLANDTYAEKLDIRADYTKRSRRGLAQVYTSTARKIVEGDHLEVLSFSQFPKTTWQLPARMRSWRSDLQDSLTWGLDWLSNC
ncbi:hypothetical protein CC80DRAFT_501674 [Byssothecium circinans]|uniref:HET-domain-containing protein n=1 Tax=Byssothecium circinans TaxID=147558 RepID=A0A6A5U6Y2_9PLEO|nr:hypothetical protein CC80DRAFT_501674 [Byssothecium circinans]